MNARRLVSLIVLMAATASLLACGSSAAAQPKEDAAKALQQRDSGAGGVTTEAIWVTPEHLAEMGNNAALPEDLSGLVLVHLTLDTHSADLAGYDLLGLTTLMGREKAVTPLQWVTISESSHHKEGILAFPGGDNQAWATKEGCAELRLRQMAQIPERTLRWEF